MEDENIISVRALSKHYQTTGASGISNISFEIGSGQIIAIIGESGSGKSTLLKTIFGLLKADSGEVRYKGKRVLGPDEQLIPGHKEMKIVTQDFSLNIYAKVYDNIASMLSNTDVKSKQEKTLAIMEHLRISHLSQKKITELSGGEQQRVAIARALVADTSVLLLDEPFSQVDALLKNQLRADLKRIVAETGLTIILVSHDPADGLFLADQLVLILKGELIQMGAPKVVYNEPNAIYTARLLGNAVVLSRQEALAIGLATGAETVVFYPEWAELRNTWNSKRYLVKDVYYKGFFEELLLERNGVLVRAIQLNGSDHKKNDHIQLNIGRFLEF